MCYSYSKLFSSAVFYVHLLQPIRNNLKHYNTSSLFIATINSLTFKRTVLCLTLRKISLSMQSEDPVVVGTLGDPAQTISKRSSGSQACRRSPANLDFSRKKPLRGIIARVGNKKGFHHRQLEANGRKIQRKCYKADGRIYRKPYLGDLRTTIVLQGLEKFKGLF